MLATSPYRLKKKGKDEEREGMLIRVEGEEAWGYADCHPWHEHGEPSLDMLRQMLSIGREHHLLSQAITFARLDAEARGNKVSLFQGLTVPKSHLLIEIDKVESSLDEIVALGVTLIKLKLIGHESVQLKALAASLQQRGIRLRLDFNSHLTPHEADLFLEKIKGVLSLVDLIEDVCPYDKTAWEMLSKKYGVTLAVDFEAPDEPHHFPIIYKPCSRPPKNTLIAKRVIVTSSLGHPVGQLMAAYAAATMPNAEKEHAGLLSHLVYEENTFSRRLKIEGGRLVPPQGTGFGYDDLLEALPWQTL